MLILSATPSQFKVANKNKNNTNRKQQLQNTKSKAAANSVQASTESAAAKVLLADRLAVCACVCSAQNSFCSKCSFCLPPMSSAHSRLILSLITARHTQFLLALSLLRRGHLFVCSDCNYEKCEIVSGRTGD